MADSVFFIQKSETITPSDTAKLSNPGRGLLLSVAGIVKVGYKDGSTDSVSLAGSVWHPMEVAQVFSTGTDADVLAGVINVGW